MQLVWLRGANCATEQKLQRKRQTRTPRIFVVLRRRYDHRTSCSPMPGRMHQPVHIVDHLSLGVPFTFIGTRAHINALRPPLLSTSELQHGIIIDIQRRTLQQQPSKLPSLFQHGIKRNQPAIGRTRNPDLSIGSESPLNQRPHLMFEKIRKQLPPRMRQRRPQELVRKRQIFIRPIRPRGLRLPRRPPIVDAHKNGRWNLMSGNQFCSNPVEFPSVKDRHSVREVEDRVSFMPLR